MGYVLEFRDQPAESLFKMTPETAVQFFKAKGLEPSFSYLDMMREEHNTAFTVAKMMEIDLLETTREAVQKAIASGQSIGQFRKELGKELKAAGWWGEQEIRDPLSGDVVIAQLGSAHRLNTIYRSNLQSAYSVGRWERIQEDKDRAPWLMYDAVDDHRTRPEHARLDGKVLPVTSSFWDEFMPPNGYGCRCGVIQLTDDDVERMGLTPLKRAPNMPREKWVNPRTGAVEITPTATDPGWNHNPGKERLKSSKKIAKDKIKALPKEWQERALVAVEAEEFFKGGHEREQWHRAGFDSSPLALKKVVRAADPIEVSRRDTGAWAQGGRLVNMPPKYDMTNRSNANTWRHEFGHILDAQLGYKSDSPALFYSVKPVYWQARVSDSERMIAAKGVKSRRGTKKRVADEAARAKAYDDVTDSLVGFTDEARRKELERLAKAARVNLQEFTDALTEEINLLSQSTGMARDVRLGKMLKAYERGDLEMFVRLGLYMDVDRASFKKVGSEAGPLRSLSDLGGATTLNKVAPWEAGYYGHSVKYYKRDSYGQGTEAFANLTALLGHSRTFWHDVARNFAPAQAAEWEKIINATAELIE